MYSTSLASSVSYRLPTIKLGPQPSLNPPPPMTAVEALIHAIAAFALTVFGIMSLLIGGKIMYYMGITAPAGVLLFSAGLIMLCIGLPERIRDVQKIWKRVNQKRTDVL